MSKTTKLPPIVAQAEWQAAHERLLAKGPPGAGGMA